MLEYLSDIINYRNDFGWQAAKGTHAILLCKKEENKVNCHETSKTNRIRRAHAQKVQSSNSCRANKEEPVPCKYFQKGVCGEKNDHKNNDQLCLQCALSYPHSHPIKIMANYVFSVLYLTLTLRKNAVGQKMSRPLLNCSASKRS